MKMAYWSSYETTVNSSSDVQWTAMVSYEAVHNSSLMLGALGAVEGEGGEAERHPNKVLISECDIPIKYSRNVALDYVIILGTVVMTNGSPD